MMRVTPLGSRNRLGASLAELVVGVVFLAAVILSLGGAVGLAARQTYRGRADMRLWAAVQWKADSLLATGFGNVRGGSDVVDGYPMSWRVSGTNPQRIDLVVSRLAVAGRDTVQDTVVLYIADPNP